MGLDRVLVFATGKGGVGKTSCSANVAGLAATARWKTLLIDLDTQANLGHDLGYRWTDQGDDGRLLRDTLATDGTLRPTLTDVRPNLDVISGGELLDDIEDVMTGRERRGIDARTALRDALAPLADDYDLIVIDTPPTRRTALVTLALAAARWVVVPTKSDRASIEGLRKLAGQIEDIRTVNPDLELLGAVLFGTASNASVVRRNAIEDVEDSLGGVAPLFSGVIRQAEAVAVEAREKGKLVHELAEVVHAAEPFWKALAVGERPKRVPGTAPALAEDYAILTQEILGRLGALEDQEVASA